MKTASKVILASFISVFATGALILGLNAASAHGNYQSGYGNYEMGPQMMDDYSNRNASSRNNPYSNEHPRGPQMMEGYGYGGCW